MNDFFILLCEDNQSDANLIDAYIKQIKLKFVDIKINYKNTDFQKVFADLNNKPDLLILDMYKKKERIGEKVLDFIKSRGIDLQIIIYTTGSKDINPTNYSELTKNYPVEDVIIKGEKGEDLRRAIEKIIFQKNKILSFGLNDEDDIFLKADIRSIGKNNLNEILYNVKIDIAFTGKIILERMSSGFSGAAIFKLRYDNNTSILKISREKDTLKEEHDNANRLYKLFPSRFRINIESKEYRNDEVLAFLIEEVEDGLPLLKWLKEKDANGKISEIFNELFLNKGLNEHYMKKRGRNKEKFSYIFRSFDDVRYSLIKKAIKELEPIIQDYSTLEFIEVDIKNMILNGNYKKLDKNVLLEEKFRKELVLCHGDFHSKNIMVQNDKPIIIDTGAIKYDYWCMDISRLIVDLFIMGLDQNSSKFFDIHEINEYLILADKLINQEQLNLDDKNNGIFNAINWLNTNLKEIYGDLYTKWELQLGLMKEFLQVSYRITSTPASKRALALLCAYKCLICANNELEALM